MGATKVQSFVSWLREQHYADDTVRNYALYARRAEEFLGELDDADPELLTDWLRTLPPSAGSWNQGRKAMAAWFRFQGIEPNPVERVQGMPEPTRVANPITEEERDRFIQAAQTLGGMYRVIGLMFATTAARFFEVQRAKWDQFDLGKRPSWRIEGKGSGRRGRKVRVIPLHPEIVPILAAWRIASRDPVYVFPGASGDGWIGDTALRRRFDDICRLAGFVATPHRCRHAWATIALEQTMDIRAVQEVLGHESLSTTQRYTKNTIGRLAAVVAAVPV